MLVRDKYFLSYFQSTTFILRDKVNDAKWGGQVTGQVSELILIIQNSVSHGGGSPIGCTLSYYAPEHC